jgi:hypothetical protein
MKIKFKLFRESGGMFDIVTNRREDIHRVTMNNLVERFSSLYHTMAFADVEIWTRDEQTHKAHRSILSSKIVLKCSSNQSSSTANFSTAICNAARCPKLLDRVSKQPTHDGMYSMAITIMNSRAMMFLLKYIYSGRIHLPQPEVQDTIDELLIEPEDFGEILTAATEVFEFTF